MRLFLFAVVIGCGGPSSAAPGIYPTNNQANVGTPVPVGTAPAPAPLPNGSATLKIVIGGTAPVGTYTITVDDKEVPASQYAAYPVAPGTHKITASYVGRFGKREQMVDVQAGEQKEVLWTLMMKH